MTQFSERVRLLVDAAGKAIGRPAEGRRHLARRAGVSDDTVRRYLQPGNPGSGHKVISFAAKLGLSEAQIRGFEPFPEGFLERFATAAWDAERNADPAGAFIDSLTPDQKARLRQLLKAS